MTTETAFTGIQERLDREAMRRQVGICLEHGAHGIAALGLATEVSKLTVPERRTVMEWTSEDVGGRKPLGFTIYGTSVGEQVELVRAAEAAKAVATEAAVAVSFRRLCPAELSTATFFVSVVTHALHELHAPPAPLDGSPSTRRGGRLTPSPSLFAAFAQVALVALVDWTALGDAAFVA
eukprot:gene8715-11179_t